MNNETLTNHTLAQYLAIKEQITALEKQLKPLKEEIEAAGSLETDQFSVEIKAVTVNRTVGCDELLEKVGIVKVNELGLIKESTYNKITVKQKLVLKKAA